MYHLLSKGPIERRELSGKSSLQDSDPARVKDGIEP